MRDQATVKYPEDFECAVCEEKFPTKDEYWSHIWCTAKHHGKQMRKFLEVRVLPGPPKLRIKDV